MTKIATCLVHSKAHIEGTYCNISTNIQSSKRKCQLINSKAEKKQKHFNYIPSVLLLFFKNVTASKLVARFSWDFVEIYPRT